MGVLLNRFAPVTIAALFAAAFLQVSALPARGADTIYEFGKSTFSKMLCLNKGAEFSNVTLVEVEMINEGAFKLNVVKRDGAADKVISSGPRSNEHGGWSTFNFSAGMNPPVIKGMSPYRLCFQNAGPGTRKVLQGRVTSAS